MPAVPKVTFPTIAVQSKRDPPYTNSLRNGLQSIMKPGPEPLSNKAMTAAERQARFRATHANGAPRIRYQNPADRHSRAQRWWHAAVAELIALQDDYQTCWTRCRRTLRQARRPKRCARSVILIYPISRAWSRRAVLVATDANSACRLPGSPTSRAR